MENRSVSRWDRFEREDPIVGVEPHDATLSRIDLGGLSGDEGEEEEEEGGEKEEEEEEVEEEEAEEVEEEEEEEREEKEEGNGRECGGVSQHQAQGNVMLKHPLDRYLEQVKKTRRNGRGTYISYIWNRGWDASELRHSPTALIARIFPFDGQSISYGMAKRNVFGGRRPYGPPTTNGMNQPETVALIREEQEKILDGWKESTELGSELHSEIEGFYLRGDGIGKRFATEAKQFELYDERMRSRGYRVVRTEWMVCAPTYNVKGRVDCVWLKEGDGFRSLILTDWKRSKHRLSRAPITRAKERLNFSEQRYRKRVLQLAFYASMLYLGGYFEVDKAWRGCMVDEVHVVGLHPDLGSRPDVHVVRSREIKTYHGTVMDLLNKANHGLR